MQNTSEGNLRIQKSRVRGDRDSAMGHELRLTTLHSTLTMASVASQIVFHPTVSQCLKFGGTTLGRDKVNNV